MAIIGEGDHCQPLLPPSAGQVIVGEITTSPPQEMPTPPPKNQRLVSLDVFRGLTVGLMILVDDAGGVFPSINHSSWFEVTLPDFVMSFFLFGVGVFVSLVFKKVPNRVDATKKVRLRTIKLFVLGVLLQGGYFHGRHDLTYGVNVRKIRWLGMLQVTILNWLIVRLKISLTSVIASYLKN
ncbi:unnamed protein product [Linum trigynum]|uniref:Heparan-alpha-glucosaminide N-acetyltransferase catalytic domain-containing protein n=1 Tax=Linum trigynum TaxID=586398 RepID=A0AAV2CEE6_9ROSI